MPTRSKRKKERPVSNKGASVSLLTEEEKKHLGVFLPFFLFRTQRIKEPFGRKEEIMPVEKGREKRSVIPL